MIFIIVIVIIIVLLFLEIYCDNPRFKKTVDRIQGGSVVSDKVRGELISSYMRGKNVDIPFEGSQVDGLHMTPAEKDAYGAFDNTFHRELVNYPQLPYREHVYNGPYIIDDSEVLTIPSHIHRGQRKLMLEEVDFMNRHGDKSKLVVYAGAAPGFHIPALINMFPEHTFHLWDPRTIFPGELGLGIEGHDDNSKKQNWHAIKKTLTDEQKSKVKIFQGYYDPKPYEGRDYIFISDIRTATDNKSVHDNLMMQQQWIIDSPPKAYSLKFRTPFQVPEGHEEEYPNGNLSYIGGKILVQPWAPVTSAEMRLIGTPEDEDITVNITEHEQRSFYFNFIVRNYGFSKDVKSDYEYHCGCFDCWLENSILDEYNGPMTKKEILDEINSYCGGLNIAPHPHTAGTNGLIDKIASTKKHWKKVINKMTNRRSNKF